MLHSFRRGSAAIVIVLLVAVCAAGAGYWYFGMPKESAPLSPDEAAFALALEAGEALVSAAPEDAESCARLKAHIDESQAVFKRLLPVLKPFDVRARDERIGSIKAYFEAHCR